MLRVRPTAADVTLRLVGGDQGDQACLQERDHDRDGGHELRVGVLVVAYNAASTLAKVLDRLPPSFGHRVAAILVSDDASQDATYLVGLGYQTQSHLPITVIQQPINLGYGGNQKAGYLWAMENGLDVVVLLHGDGQYAPEVIEEFVSPFDDPDVDAVFGSRVMDHGGARRGGMPMYKFVGNRVLTAYENAMTGMRLSEWHSGYRAYRVDALRDIPFETNSDGFDFDTQVILQLHEAGKQVLEVPIPTYYGDEICYVSGLRYARDVATHVTRYRLHKMGFGTGEMAFGEPYQLKMTASSSHGRLLSLMSRRPPCRVLDVGCSDGRLGELLRMCGHEVVGIDIVKHDGVADRLNSFVEADLDEPLPTDVGRDFDVIVALDVLEHTRDPDRVLRQLTPLLAASGVVLACVPNFGHWYPRTRVALGRFDYDRRGILDFTHLRFFTKRSFDRLARRNRLEITRRHQIGLPIEVAERGGDHAPRGLAVAKRVDASLASAWPSLFAYQFLYELRPC
jgi:glycosyltransferase involved in cell wall biosynthesis